MMVGIQLDVDLNLDRLQGAVRHILAKATNMRPLSDAIGAAMVAATQERFATKTSPDGVAWQPWSQAYEKQRGGRGALLQRDNHLLESIDYACDPAGVSIGSNRIYAAIQQMGSIPGAGRPFGIPARPYLGASSADHETIDAIITDFLTEIAGGRS